MAYTPTEWETGDVITAEKLNNMEQGIEDAFVAPEVTAADQGKVLTVDSSGEWDAENLPADKTYIMTATAELGLLGWPESFTLDTGDVSEIDNYEDVVIKVALTSNSATGGYLYVTKALRMYVDSSMQPSNTVQFSGIILNPLNNQLGRVGVVYNMDTSTWSILTKIIETQ